MFFWTDIYYVFKREFYAVFRDHAVLTFFVALMLGYPVVYTFIYSNEVAREVPVAVVDHSKSTLSREFIRNWDATASVDVVARCEDMEAAKLLMYKKGIYGILEIPSDFSKNVARGTGSRISLLRYGSVVELQGFVNGRDGCFFGDGEEYTGARNGICHGDHRADCIFSRTDSRREVV